MSKHSAVTAFELPWLPEEVDWLSTLKVARTLPPLQAFASFQALANTRMDFTRAANLARAMGRSREEHGAPDWPRLRLAVLGSSTLHHLLPGIHLGALRRGLLLDIVSGEYGMYRQELADAASPVHRFAPDVVLLCLDAEHLAGADSADDELAFETMRQCWRDAQTKLNCTVIQQTVMPVFPAWMGNSESRLRHAPAAIVERLNHRLQASAEQEGIYLLTVDRWAAWEGLAHWYDPALWFRAKQEIHPRASNLFGDQVGRLLGALNGKSAKCLVLDLDNTLWGGVIGDEGLGGIVLGQGSTVGEAHLALQRYARQLLKRGVILAVCSKNDLPIALTPFEQHADMILRRDDIACFVANWQDKATNLRYIAKFLNIGLDALVFVDDNPAERALIRRELPMVKVPELPEDPAGFVPILASAGYFEAVHITQDDEARGKQYRDNAEREQLRQSTTDMAGFLTALQMKLTWSAFDEVGLKRIVQLANKTNQFNLTTRRYTEAEIEKRMHGEEYVTLQLRLEDVYGDNGIIALIVALSTPGHVLELETWLMSCRVLGRSVEQATLAILVKKARELECLSIIGVYRPSGKNGMVEDLYERLGFHFLSRDDEGSTRWKLDVKTFAAQTLPIESKEAITWKTLISTAS